MTYTKSNVKQKFRELTKKAEKAAVKAVAKTADTQKGVFLAFDDVESIVYSSGTTGSIVLASGNLAKISDTPVEEFLQLEAQLVVNSLKTTFEHGLKEALE